MRPETFVHARAAAALFALSALFVLIPAAGAAPSAAPKSVSAVELLYLAPLDTAAVRIDSSLAPERFAALEAAPAGALIRRTSATRAGQAARSFHPMFGEAVARAARRVQVIDASGATPLPAERPLRFARRGDTLVFNLPAPVGDSARYLLAIGRLTLSEKTESVARRFVPPSEPEFDPTTGTVRPGNRKGYAEGPGRVSVLSARAEWIVWDEHAGKATHRGVAQANASSRGEPGRAQWEELARELAKAVLKQTAFSPW